MYWRDVFAAQNEVQSTAGGSLSKPLSPRQIEMSMSLSYHPYAWQWVRNDTNEEWILHDSLVKMQSIKWAGGCFLLHFNLLHAPSCQCLVKLGKVLYGYKIVSGPLSKQSDMTADNPASSRWDFQPFIILLGGSTLVYLALTLCNIQTALNMSCLSDQELCTELHNNAS